MTVLVVGGGLAGLVAARAARQRGDTVVLVEADSRLGGSIRGVELAGSTIDIGAESIANRGTAAMDLVRELGLETAAPRTGGAWLQVGARAVPLPSAGVLGIPSAPLADDVRAAIGTRAALRAYLDTVRPELRVGRTETLGSLVHRRMGAAVLDTLVRPVVEGVYGVDPDDADADVLVPGLTTALARAGSLAGAVSTVRRSAPAGAAVTGIVGGVHLLVSALEADLRRSGVAIHTGLAATAIERDGTGWRLVHEGGHIDGEEVVIATGGRAARALLAPLIAEEFGSAASSLEGWPAERTTTVVALALDDERLDAASRGTGVLVAQPEPGTASALTHSSSKWPWLAEALPSGRHIVRLTYRGAPEELDDARVKSDAYRLLGVQPRAGALVDRRDAVWTQDAARATVDVQARASEIIPIFENCSGISVTGSWISGTGIAAVVLHSRAIMEL